MDSYRLLVLFCVICLPLAADQLTLKNGDRVTGKIVKKAGDKITVKSDLMGEVTIAWDAVTSVASDEPLTVVLPGGKSVVGTVNTTDGNLTVAAETAALPEVGAIRNAGEQRAYERVQQLRWLDLWVGYFDLGLATARGNAKTQTFTAAFNATRVTPADKATLYYTQIYATATVDGDTSVTARAVRGGWSYNRNVSPRLFVNTFNDYEFDGFQNLDLRFALGLGLGFSALKSERGRLDFLGGGNYVREKFTTPLTRNSAEVFWGDDWTYKLNAVTSLRQSFRVFNNLTDRGEFRANFDLGATLALRKWLSWQLSASDRYLSNPAEGRLRNDLLLTTGFRISFTR